MNNIYLSGGRGSGKSYKQAKLMREYVENMKTPPIEETINCLSAIIEYEENFQPGGKKLVDYAIKYKIDDYEELKRINQTYDLKEAKKLLNKLKQEQRTPEDIINEGVKYFEDECKKLYNEKNNIEQQAINKILEFKQQHGHLPTIICLDKKDKCDLLESVMIHRSDYNYFLMGVVVKEHNSVEILVK